MRPCLPNPRPPRRGVTLLEMLVAVALLVLMMTIVTSIFQAATGAITVAKTYQELDGNLRQLDSVLRQDLSGATADTGSGPLTPPFDPDLNLGYLEIGENQFADIQGEDSDDYIRFTVQAPEGQPFTGRMWVGPVFINPPANTVPNQPVMIQSQFAEVIYFLRNGNLYRRVFLVAPERQAAVNAVATLNGGTCPTQFPAAAFGYTTANPVFGGWLGMNDLSARPSTVPGAAPILNTLGDLTNRENRAFYPRFCNAYVTGTGQRDDVNVDSVADWWPTLYPSVFSTGLVNPTQLFVRSPNTTTNAHFPDLMSFPYTFPGAYSQADPSSNGGGVLHGMGSAGSTGIPIIQGTAMTAAPTVPPYGYVYTNGAVVYPTPTPPPPAPLPYSQPNHNPIPTGDSLTTPDPVAGPLQTWWGFPTWKETMSPNWADPVFTLASGSGTQATGLSWYLMNNSSALLNPPFNPPLPPLTDPTLDLQQYNDGKGNFSGANNFSTPPSVFRDDIIMQGVRSFDVKVYDNAVPGYVDLGYSNFAAGVTTTLVPGKPPTQQQFAVNVLLPTMGHEGRIPPLTTDYRSDPNYPNWLPNIGDDTAGLNRLRRVWDTWSTDYTNAPANGLDAGSVTGYPVAGPPTSQPVYPSYPPPYAVPLRGLQIQVRVVDPRNERIKVLTIRHSFSN
ncbi:MAG: prepilin-type N-terminal cleavage/methylation domain-containing protein [Isosphaeraceae bacterium]|nr:prepilin-type N-terminal cleavage/methylation domain-containing protein [Isosphaeraceae bacterium]